MKTMLMCLGLALIAGVTQTPALAQEALCVLAIGGGGLPPTGDTYGIYDRIGNDGEYYDTCGVSYDDNYNHSTALAEAFLAGQETIVNVAGVSYLTNADNGRQYACDVYVVTYNGSEGDVAHCADYTWVF
jgi:hypothetical protein